MIKLDNKNKSQNVSVHQMSILTKPTPAYIGTKFFPREAAKKVSYALPNSPAAPKIFFLSKGNITTDWSNLLTNKFC